MRVESWCIRIEGRGFRDRELRVRVLGLRVEG